jgi:hypothetical protein
MEELPRTYLTENEVTEIKSLLWDGTLTQTEIAERFHTSQPTISRILRGKEWGHILWPDGSEDNMPLLRYQVIQRSKHTSAYSSQSRARLRQTEVSFNAAEAVSKAVEAALQKKDKSLLTAMKQSGTAGKGKEGKKATNWDALPWENIVEEDPANPLVREFALGGDTTLQLATCITLFAIPRKEWATQQTVALAHRIADRLRGEMVDN